MATRIVVAVEFGRIAIRDPQHPGVGGVERRATIGERQDMVERQVPRWMRRMLGTIARAPLAVLAAVAGDLPLGPAVHRGSAWT